MPELSDIFALVHRYHAYGVKLNVETKVEAGAPARPRRASSSSRSSPGRSGRPDPRQVTIQSFDWGALMRMGEVAPGCRWSP